MISATSSGSPKRLSGISLTSSSVPGDKIEVSISPGETKMIDCYLRSKLPDGNHNVVIEPLPENDIGIKLSNLKYQFLRTLNKLLNYIIEIPLL